MPPSDVFPSRKSEIKRTLEKHFIEVEKCELAGHVPGQILFDYQGPGTKVKLLCSKCRILYERLPNPDEVEKYERTLENETE
ncbi:MAG TPA: hypothetical protein VJZ93_01540 [Candidatus Nanoarchaeia archaeon]|nr:hypothetical protein [Candidatus Nanoarchaeia archaeon]